MEFPCLFSYTHTQTRSCEGVTDALVTNFHMPYSIMLMMTTAFGGYDLVMKAYDEAISEKYRFGAYGDAMLIL